MRAAIRERWGDGAVGNRQRIGEIVFDDPAELDWLEQLLHPRTRARWPTSGSRRSTRPLAVVEIPLLYETGGEARFDEVVVDHRPARAPRGSGAAPSPTARRGSCRTTEKVARADFAYVNDGSLEELDAFVAGVVENLSSS